MAEICKDIDQGLAALNRKIDEQNKRLRELEQKQKQCCNSKDNGDSSNNDDLKKRLKKLEDDLKVIINFILQLKPILQTLKNFSLFDLF